jgi:hypothetical protein
MFNTTLKQAAVEHLRTVHNSALDERVQLCKHALAACTTDDKAQHVSED